jgi:tetratricopeptide (TPR) repeat protein
VSRLGLIWFGVVVCVLAPGSVRADRYDDANRQLLDTEERVRSMVAVFRDDIASDPHAAERRVLDAELLFNLKNYTEAATICLDVIEKYPDSRSGLDALLLLGESLYREQDFIAARRYLERAVQKNTKSRKEQAALMRIVEIALQTNDLGNVDQYLARLDGLSEELLVPEVPYVRGKFSYFQGKFDKALAVFAAISPGSPYYLRSRYFIGTIHVKKENLKEAIRAFQAVQKLGARTEDEQEIRHLASMALGRAYYESSQFDKARGAYQSVPRQSKHYADALYELTWTSIKADDFTVAQRSLDLMLLKDSDSPRAPELRILLGNLHLRLSNFYLADESFTKLRNEFEPLHLESKGKLAESQADPRYFDRLLAGDLEQFDISLFVPSNALRWLRAEPDVAQMLVLAGEVGELQRDISAADDTLGRLDRAVHDAGKVGIFPDLASVRVSSTEVLNQLVELRRAFVALAHKLVSGALDEKDKAALNRVSQERAILEQQVQSLPTTAEGLRIRADNAKGALGKLDEIASELNVEIQSSIAQLVAIERYFIHSKAEQNIKADDLVQPVKDLREAIAQTQGALDVVRTQLEDAHRAFGAAGAAAASERRVAVNLAALFAREQEVLRRGRSRLSAGDQAELDRVERVMRRIDPLQATLLEFDGRVDATAERRLVTIRTSITAEKASLEAAKQALTGVMSQSHAVGGGLAQVMLSKVTERFYDIVVQADVGAVDISWGLKDEKTQTLTSLIKQQKQELQAVQEDFRDVLSKGAKE